MEKELLKQTFRDFKKASGVDYAITYPDNLGDCMSCVNYALCEKYGEESKGVWVKHWTHGMNGHGHGVEGTKSVYVAHDLTEEQAKVFYEVFSEHYNVTPEEYDPSKCFRIYEKGTAVWRVNYHDNERDKDYTEEFTDIDKAIAYANSLGQYEEYSKIWTEPLFCTETFTFGQLRYRHAGKIAFENMVAVIETLNPYTYRWGNYSDRDCVENIANMLGVRFNADGDIIRG